MSALSQLVNILNPPGGGYNEQYPFPEVNSASPCPQYMLMSNTVVGGYNNQQVLTSGPSAGATAQGVVFVEFWTGNNKQAIKILTSQTITTIQGIIL